MKRFILSLIVFFILLGSIGEIVIRVFRLSSDIPERVIDEFGIQRFKLGQSGYYKKAKQKWNVNKFGWMGTSDTSKDTLITIIGDSFIENIMNPIECNQGSILNNLFPNISFFEAGRSGVTFIEAMEITKVLNIEVEPKYQLIYLNPTDLPESILEVQLYSDRLQISIEKNEIQTSQIKSPGLKKILYNIKLLYYLYSKYPILVDKQNKGEIDYDFSEREKANYTLFHKFFSYLKINYRLDNLLFVLHPDMDKEIVSLMKEYNLKIILLDSKGDKKWEIGNGDSHWSCYGHSRVSKQVRAFIKKKIIQIK